MQDELGSSIRDAVVLELEHFLKNMNYPEDLLTYNAEYLEPMTQQNPESPEEGSLLGRHTDLGRFIRQVVLAIRSLPFEVGFLTLYRVFLLLTRLSVCSLFASFCNVLISHPISLAYSGKDLNPFFPFDFQGQIQMSFSNCVCWLFLWE